MTIHPRDIASRIAATEDILNELAASEQDEPQQPPEPAPEPSQAPEPQSGRPEGWTPDKQARFLEALAVTHSVAAAAREVGMSRQSAYQLRARLRGEPFDLAWEAAFQTAFDALTEAAMERALNGVEVPHLHKGEVVHTSRRYDERLTVALLAMRLQPRRAHRGFTHRASIYTVDDLPALIARVERGPATWDGTSAYADDGEDE
jgi:hypothetical protein